MTKRRWMPLYIADYLADTAHLNATESGAYLHLIMHYWVHGGLPTSVDKLCIIAKISSHRGPKILPILQKFFHNGWKHKRIDKELERFENISKKRSSAAKLWQRNKRTNVAHLHTHARARHLYKEDSSNLLSNGPPVENSASFPQDGPPPPQQQTGSEAPLFGKELEPVPLTAEEHAELIASLDRLTRARPSTKRRVRKRNGDKARKASK